MKKLWSILLSVILVLGMSTSVFAADNSPLIVDKNAKGSLTLYKYEVKSPEPMPTGKPSGTTITPAPDKENIVLLDGVTFELTKVEDLNGNPVEGATPVSATTGDKTENFTTGQVKWTDLELGKYKVHEASIPENVSSVMDDFYVDIPMTNKDGDGWIYDVVLYPKNMTVYGTIKLTKYGEENGTALPGVMFKLQKYTGNETVTEEMVTNNNWGGTYTGQETDWADYRTTEEFKTGSDGTLTITNLPKGIYRLVETAAVAGTTNGPNYALHNKPVVFIVEDDTEVPGSKNNYFKPTVDKKIDLDAETYRKGDPITWDITVDVPKDIEDYKEFYISDTLNTNLSFDTTVEKLDASEGVAVYGIDSTGNETLLERTANGKQLWKLGSSSTTSGGVKVTTLKIIFIDKDAECSVSDQESTTPTFNGDPDRLGLYDSLRIELTTKIETIPSAANPITNKVELDYDNNYGTTDRTDSGEPDKDTTDKAEPVIKKAGVVTITKQDKDDSTKLANAQFKVYESQTDAETGTNAMKDASNPTADAIFTTDGNGQFTIPDLVYSGESRDLYLVEVKAPEGYKLLADPVTITINSDPVSKTIGNKKSTLWDDMMPATGGLGTPLFLAMGICVVIFGLLYYRRQSRKN